MHIPWRRVRRPASCSWSSVSNPGSSRSRTRRRSSPGRSPSRFGRKLGEEEDDIHQRLIQDLADPLRILGYFLSLRLLEPLTDLLWGPRAKVAKRDLKREINREMSTALYIGDIHHTFIIIRQKRRPSKKKQKLETYISFHRIRPKRGSQKSAVQIAD